jgi:hypothetical protein
MRVSRADWAALAPWEGIQGKPPFLEGPDGQITISDVQGLQAALAARALISQLARVAFTGNYSDLNNPPHFGSAAFVDIGYFLVAWTAKTLQIGSVPMVSGTQKYSVVFTQAMNAVPKIRLQVFMADDNGELIFATVTRDSVTTTGFSFWLSSAPSASTGEIEYEAVVQDQP